ncbi:MAG: universal stress protein [Hyphomonadaceae bacterium]
MSWKRITVVACGAGEGISLVKAARDVAIQLGAQLDVIVPVLMPTPQYGTSMDLLSRGFDELRRRCLLEAHAAAERVALIAAGSDHRIRVLDFSEGDLRALAASWGRSSDVVVVSQPSAVDRSNTDTEVLVGVLLGSGRPCVMLPDWKDDRPWGKRALVAWKGTPEAARALAGALPLLRSADETRICIVNPRSEREGEDEENLHRVCDYLRMHGVRVEAPKTMRSREAPETVLAAEIEAFHADLLVMGAYSRPRLQEIMFGGTTAAMIREARIPVLLAH